MSHGAYREAHPLPAVLWHWTNLLCMIVLTVSGFFIHYPFTGARMDLFRYMHFIAMYVILISLAWRVYWAFFGRGTALTKGTREIGRDYKNFGPQPENKGNFLEILKYYLFLRKTHPVTAKFNALQKGTYVFWVFLLLAQAYTGFAIYGPFDQLPVFSVFTGLVGGLMAVRMIHFAIMWVFILTTMIHVYLSVAEDVEAVPLMFAWKETPATEEH